jgi:hypothetical protein
MGEPAIANIVAARPSERGHAADIGLGLRGHERIGFMSGRAPHRISETMDSQAEHGQWMSVAELATKRRISEGSAARLVRRRKWQRRTDPDNVTRILVPDVAVDTHNRGEDRSRQSRCCGWRWRA